MVSEIKKNATRIREIMNGIKAVYERCAYST